MFPAGKYYVGDLCYVMHDEWDEVCGLFFEGRDDHGCNQGMFKLKDGRTFASFNTKYGDGAYFDQNGEEYGVDAGLIGCIALNDIDLNADGNFTRGGQIIQFDSDFTVSGGDSYENRRDWDGVIRIGHIVIRTDDCEVY
jgi:hypothetical protein